MMKRRGRAGRGCMVSPQRVTDHGDRLTGVVFLRGKYTAEDGLNAERRNIWELRRAALICSGCAPPESSNDVVI